MTDDLEARARKALLYESHGEESDLPEQLANEIARLRAEVERLKGERDAYKKDFDDMQEQRDEISQAAGRAAGDYVRRVDDLEAERDAVLVREAALRDGLDRLQCMERVYRERHDFHGDGHLETGRAWDHMRRAGDIARATLAAHPAPEPAGEGETDDA